VIQTQVFDKALPQYFQQMKAILENDEIDVMPQEA
jgi:hypothetical protein